MTDTPAGFVIARNHQPMLPKELARDLRSRLNSRPYGYLNAWGHIVVARL